MAVFIGIFTLGVQQAKATSLLALTQGATLSIFDKQFDRWAIPLNGNDNNVDLRDIDVTTFGDALNPGLRYTASNDALSSDTGGLFLEFQFRVSTNSGASLIKDNSLEVGVNDFFFGGDGFFTIDEDVFKDDQFSSPVLDEFGSNVFKQVAANSTGNNLLFQNVNFLSQQSEIFVDTRILLELAPGPLSGITQFE
ncbi:MAG: hypothetical protein IH977_11530 [Nitrospinae bacterium]|nr:hypothetical protein [Nitrospinota bacterium]